MGVRKTTITGGVAAPEEGLILGNGDLSVSLYQKPGLLVWRFGKNDVWDRRHDRSDDPVPAHIDEIAHGIRDEGWTNESFGIGDISSRVVSDNEKRMQEICTGYPSYAFRPYPCPKPVGELALHLPSDQPGMELEQTTDIEKGLISVECVWTSGVRLTMECFIPPDPNVFIMSWRVEGWTDEAATGVQPVWFSLYRWADPHIRDFAVRWVSESGNDHFLRNIDPKSTPLPPPEIRLLDGTQLVEQRFYPDPDSAEGLRCAMVPIVRDTRIFPVSEEGGQAALLMRPDEGATKGVLAVGVATGNEEGQADAACRHIIEQIGDPQDSLRRLRAATVAAGAEFWSRSAVETGDETFDRAWYETLHARRCAFRHDTIAPGLFLPSTVNDYSLWHGDYHTNYNYQEPFWGDYAANQVSMGDSYFPGMAYAVELGRKLAREYWNCRGTFIQLSLYPFTIEDDPLGTCSLCRMAYMTGWVANHYWSRYLHTMDTEWLREYGYPVIRDAALFYADFLKKGEDALYHAFPSGQGEYHYTGNPKDYTDQPQVMRHAGYTLRYAIRAAEALDCDTDDRERWRELADNMAQVDDLQGLNQEQRRQYELVPPEFLAFEGPRYGTGEKAPEFLRRTKDNPQWSWYFGHFPWIWMGHLRNRSFTGDRDYPVVRQFLERWRLPNGLFRAMSLQNYGYAGAWSESMGILAPIQEMLMESWDGIIRIFPFWPKEIDASFRTHRACGAFLVSASWVSGAVAEFVIESEKGGECLFESPWGPDTAVRCEDEVIAAAQDERGVTSFSTTPGRKYVIQAR